MQGLYMGPIEPGWYPDPAASEGLRFFDGAWSEHALDVQGQPSRTPADSDWPPPPPTPAATEPSGASWTARPSGQPEPSPHPAVTVTLSLRQRRHLYWFVVVAALLAFAITIMVSQANQMAEGDELLREMFPRSAPAENLEES